MSKKSTKARKAERKQRRLEKAEYERSRRSYFDLLMTMTILQGAVGEFLRGGMSEDDLRYQLVISQSGLTATMCDIDDAFYRRESTGGAR